MVTTGTLSANDLDSRNVAMCVEDCNVLPSLRAYQQCKKERELTSHVIFVLPQSLEAQYLAHTRNMQFMGILHGSQLFPNTDRAARKYSVFHDAPAVKPGVLAADRLPHSLQQLRVSANAVSGDELDLTFVFDGKVAGLPSTVLWDSGAKCDFISADFAHRNALHVQPTDLECFLANGDPVVVAGEVRVRVQIPY